MMVRWYPLIGVPSYTIPQNTHSHHTHKKCINTVYLYHNLSHSNTIYKTKKTEVRIILFTPRRNSKNTALCTASTVNLITWNLRIYFSPSPNSFSFSFFRFNVTLIFKRTAIRPIKEKKKKPKENNMQQYVKHQTSTPHAPHLL